MSFRYTFVMLFVLVVWSILRGSHVEASRSYTNDSIQVDFITTGYFGTTDLDVTSLSYNAPAILTGVQRLRDIYPQHRWSSTFVTDPEIRSCLPTADIVQLLLSRWYYTRRNENSRSIIVAPGCIEGVYMNQLAAQFDILLLTSASADTSIRDRQRSPTWLSTTPFASPNLVYCSMLAYMNWTTVFVCLDNQEKQYQQYAYGRITAKLSQCGIQFTITTDFSSLGDATSTRRVLEEFRSKSRVFLYFGRPPGLRKLLIEATFLNMTTGEHVYLVVVPWTSASYGNFTWQKNHSDDEVVKRAYQSVLLLTLIDESRYVSEIVKDLTKKWEHISSETFNETDVQFALSLPITTATHAAMELAGMAVVEAYTRVGTQVGDSGKQLAGSLLNRTANLQVGKWRINGVGLSQTDSQLGIFDRENGRFKVFAKASDTNADYTFNWSRTSLVINWYGRTILPPTTPRCGFDGKSLACYEGQNLDAQTAGSCIAIVLVCAGVAVVSVRIIKRERAISCLWWVLDNSIFAIKERQATVPRSRVYIGHRQ